MPKINVYLPDDLAAEVHKSTLPVSAICQRALREAIDDLDEAPHYDRPEDLVLSPHVASMLSLSRVAAGRRGVLEVESEDLLQAMLDENESLVLRGVEHLGFTRRSIQEALDKKVTRYESTGIPVEEFGASARDVIAAARADAAESRLGQVNGGHLMWALATARGGRSREVLDEIGFTAAVDRRVLGLIEIGYSYGRQTRHTPLTVSTELARISARLTEIEKKLG
ncbi:MAG: Clp protease N-terminal domain-containing protein [Gordonia sp. (in: high G+C Gram-positive bacteria)]